MPNKPFNCIPGATSSLPASWHLFGLVSGCHECATISFLWLLHISWRKAWEQPLAHSGVLWVPAVAGHLLQEELLSLCPLTLGWWPRSLPAAKGFSSMPLSMGQEGAPPPWLPVSVWKPKSLLGSDGACKCLSGKIRKGIVPARCVVSWQRGVYPAVVIVGELRKQRLQSHPMLQDPALHRLSEDAASLLINRCHLLSGVSYSGNHAAPKRITVDVKESSTFYLV